MAHEPERAWVDRHLLRITSSGRFLPEIDGLRFVAVMAVLLFHANGYVVVKGGFAGEARASVLDLVLRQGFIGVQLFFVISGLVLALPFAEQRLRTGEPVGLKRYYLRRLTRLEPPYVVNLLLLAALLVLVNGQSAATTLRHLLPSLFYVHNVVHETGSRINSVAWSLEIEVQFYLLAPLLASVFRIAHPMTRRATIVLLGLPSAALASLLDTGAPGHGLTLGHQLHYFMAGFLLADLHVTDWRDRPQRSVAWDGISTAAWLALLAVVIQRDVFELLAPPLICVAYVGAFRGVLLRRLFRCTPLVVVGGACYTIYLYHPTLLSAVGRVTTSWRVARSYEVQALAQLALLVPAVVGAGLVLYCLFERPFMRRDWPQRLRSVALGSRRLTDRVRRSRSRTP